MAIICSRCGFDNPSGVPVCAKCASPLANACPYCNFENPKGFKFCGNCGANLLTAALLHGSDAETLRRLQGYIPNQLVEKILSVGKQIEGERRTVTVLFSDIVGFTTISEQLDPEQVYAIIDTCVAAFREAIYRHEGTLDKFMGDGVMALFGAPVAHEDDAARAARSALEMQASIKRISQEIEQRHGVSLQVRIGLNLGTVIVGDIRSDLKMNYTALGDTVNVAARLQSVAEPGAILVSRAVYDQTRALFDFAEEGSIRVKGRVEPVEIFELEGPRRDPQKVRGIPGLAAPMVGRQKELALVKDAADRLISERRGTVTLISGEPGIGKSRLIGELRNHLDHLPVRVCDASCASYGQTAYDLIAKLLKSYMDIQGDESEDSKRAKIELCVQQALPPDQSPADLLPYIENLLGVTIVEKTLSDRIRHLEPAQLRQQTYLAVRDLLVAHSRSEPLFLVLEDLHWVDSMSFGLILFLFDAADTAPLALLCTSRPKENEIASRVLQVGASTLGDKFLHIPLRPLSFADSAALVDLLLTTAELPESLRELIPQRAEGNPFYLEEIIRMMIDRRMIRRVDEHWEMARDIDLAGFEVPRTLEGLIMTRVDNLPESSRFALQCASVIGRDFTHELLRRIMTGEGQLLEPSLQELVDHELVSLSSEQPERQYEFRHILTQLTVYNSLLSSRRSSLHLQVAQAIDELYASHIDEQCERLAFHYSEAKDAPHALHYLIRSAERASARFATEQALEYHHAALKLVDQANATVDQRIRIFSGLADAKNFLGDYTGSVASYQTALEVARANPTSPRQARGIAEIARRLGRVHERRGDKPEALRWLESALREINHDPESGRAPERARIYLDIGWVHYRQGSLEEAYQWDMRALEISEGLDYYSEMGSAYNRLAALFVDKYDWRRATEYAEKGLAFREMIGDTEGIARSHSNLGVIAAELCDWDQAIFHFRRSLEIRQRIGQAKGLCNAYTNLGRVYVIKGESGLAHEHIIAAKKLAEKIHDPDQICLALNALAETELLDENWDTAITLLEASLRTAAEIESKDHASQAYQLLAQACLGGGDVQEAIRNARHALLVAEESGNRQSEASAFRVLGAAERAERRWHEAESDLSRSIGIFGDLQNQLGAARAELELALLYRDQGMQLDAHALLERCRDSFSRFGVEAYRRRAEVALS
jgi:adenylate cyclase